MKKLFLILLLFFTVSNLFAGDFLKKWEFFGQDKGWMFVLRDAETGKFVDMAQGQLEFWAGYKFPVLVVRDTEYKSNLVHQTGQFLTYLKGQFFSYDYANGTKETWFEYRDPDSKKWIRRIQY